jgi:hypothetical protein
MSSVAGEAAGRATGEGTGETIWLSYTELAERLRIKPSSAKRRAIDRKWPKRLGNDGRSLVAVPREIIDGATSGITGDGTGDIADEIDSATSVLADYLRTELEETRRELRTMRGEAAETREQLARVTAEAEAQGRTVAELRRELEAKGAELETQRAEAVTARERAARAEGELAGMRPRSLWARLWGRD